MVNSVGLANSKIQSASRGAEHDVYGSRFAMSVSVGLNKARDAWVLNILMSAKMQGTNRYDREGGIRIQIADREQSDFFACMTGHLSQFEVNRRTPNHSKRFVIERDNDSAEMLISLRTGDMGTAGMVKALKSDQMKLGVLAFRTIMKNNGGVGQDVLYMMHRDIYVSDSQRLRSANNLNEGCL